MPRLRQRLRRGEQNAESNIKEIRSELYDVDEGLFLSRYNELKYAKLLDFDEFDTIR